MSNMSMNNLNIQRRVLNSIYNQPMPIFSNQCSVPLPPNQHKERNPESKINLAFGLLRKNTARTNGIWKVIQSLIDRMKKVEELTTMIDQVIKRNKELEDKRKKNNKKRNEKKRIKREKRQEEKEMKRKREQSKEIPKIKEISNEKNDENRTEAKKQVNVGPNENEERKGKENEKKFDDSRIPKNDFLEISRTKFDSRNNKFDSNNNLEISRTNLINKKIINKKKIIINKDEISFGGNQLMDNPNEDECSLQLKDKINKGNEKLSRNGRNKQNVINLVNRFIFNNNKIYNSNEKWIGHTFIPLIEDIMDLNLYELDVSNYIRRIKSPPEFRQRFWQWWQKKDIQNQMTEIQRISQKLKQSKDPDILKFFSPI